MYSSCDLLRKFKLLNGVADRLSVRNPKRHIRLALCVISAGLLTTGAVFWDTHQDLKREYSFQERFSRQIAAQAESLILEARARGDREVSNKIARLLNQNNETSPLGAAFEARVIAAPTPTTSGRMPASSPLETSFDSKTRRASIEIAVDPTRDERLQILWQSPFRGFLGTSSTWGSDLAVALVFGIFLALTYFTSLVVLGQTAPKPEAPTLLLPPAELTPSPLVQPLKALLIRAGQSIREVTRSAHALTQISSETQKQLLAFHRGVHQELNAIRTQARELEAGDPRLAELREWELKLERWSVDLDQGVSRLRSIHEPTAQLNAGVRGAMGALLEESKLLEQEEKITQKIGDLKI